MKKIVILQHKLLHYRIHFFNTLKKKALKQGYDITLIHGQPAEEDLSRKDVGTLPWSITVQNNYVKIGNKSVLWQPFPQKLKDTDLLIIMQENKILSNYYLLLLAKIFKKKIAYWGHGKNFQSQNPKGVFETFKKKLICSVDWWFAYTEASVGVLTNAGFEGSKITCLNNSIDTVSFRKELIDIREEQIKKIKGKLKIANEDKIGLLCTSLYTEKKLDFLIDACKAIKKKIKKFSMIVIGDGPEASLVKKIAAQNDWFHYLGAITGDQKAIYFKIADVLLNPGLLGLHILDAFCAGLPIVSLNTALHSPEISYIKNDHNSFLVDEDLEVYTEKVVELLSDSKLLKRISANALNCSMKFSIEKMADNFLSGIIKAIT